MSSESKFGEPWSAFGTGCHLYRIGNEEHPFLIMPSAAGKTKDHRSVLVISCPSEAFWRRIVSCVNACAGIDDPEIEVGRLRNALVSDSMLGGEVEK